MQLRGLRPLRHNKLWIRYFKAVWVSGGVAGVLPAEGLRRSAIRNEIVKNFANVWRVIHVCQVVEIVDRCYLRTCPDIGARIEEFCSHHRDVERVVSCVSPYVSNFVVEIISGQRFVSRQRQTDQIRVQLPSGLRQAVPRTVSERPSTIASITKSRQ